MDNTEKYIFNEQLGFKVKNPNYNDILDVLNIDDDLGILVTQIGVNKFIPLNILMWIKENIDKTIEFSKENDIDLLNRKNRDSYDEKYNTYLKDVISKNKTNKPTLITYTYIIKDLIRNIYKIGDTKNTKNRFKGFKTLVPKMEVISIIERPYSIEKKLHTIFQAKNIGGEWFNLDNDDLLRISELSKTL